MPAIDRESLRWYLELPRNIRGWWAITGRLRWPHRLRFILTILWCQHPPIITHRQ